MPCIEDEQGSRNRIVARIYGRERRLQRLGYRDYTAYLKSARWKETRAEYWSAADTLKVCAICGTDELPLPLHHRSYARVGSERMDDLTPVCPPCHALIHELERRGDLDGLDADLGILMDHEQAAKYRAENKDRLEEQAARRPEIEQRSLRAGKLAQQDREIKLVDAAIAKAQRKGKSSPLAEAQRERALRRRERLAAQLA